MISWDGTEDLQTCKCLLAFERSMANAIAFNSSQAAIGACLEILGSRFQPISVILPVTVSQDTLQAVIRSNARPVVVDIDPWTFQADPEQVAECLQDLPEAVVLLTRPGGMPIAPKLLEAVLDVPTICDSRLLPTEVEMVCTYNIYDISVMVGEGAVVYTKNEDQIKDLKQIRADSKSELSEVSAALAYQRHPELSTFPTGSKYSEILDKSSNTGILGFAGDSPNSTFLIKVNNVQVVLNHFAKKHNLKFTHGAIPVYKYPIMRQRWQQEPNYPNAEKVHNQLMLLPNNEGVNHQALLDEIWDVLED